VRHRLDGSGSAFLKAFALRFRSEVHPSLRGRIAPIKRVGVLGFLTLSRGQQGRGELSALVSDRLDIVRLIDSRVAATRRTVARSKHLANAAKDDLSTHEQWLERHRQRSEQDLERHQRRLWRRRRLQACRRFAVWLLLLVPSLGFALYRGVALALCTLGHLLARGSSWIDATTYAIGRGLISILLRSITWSVRKSLVLARWVLGSLALGASWLRARTSDAWLFLTGAVSQGLSWIGPRTLSFGVLLGHWLSLSFSRLAVMARDHALRLGSQVNKQGARLTTARRASNARAPNTRRATLLDPHRLQQAAFVRLRAKHDRLQARIHAMDRHYGRRVMAGAHTDSAEWAQLRQLALSAWQLFEVQECKMHGSSLPSPNGGVCSPWWIETTEIGRIHPLRAGHAIYKAPALVAGRRHA
jgi:hypothetical protein